MVVIEIDGKERKDYEVRELIIIGDSIKVSIKKIEQKDIVNLNTELFQQQNNPVLEIKNNTLPNPSQILCETQAFQGLV